jgi:hypothetical protein
MQNSLELATQAKTMRLAQEPLSASTCPSPCCALQTDNSALLDDPELTDVTFAVDLSGVCGLATWQNSWCMRMTKSRRC